MTIAVDWGVKPQTDLYLYCLNPIISGFLANRPRYACTSFSMFLLTSQGLHRLEKYLNIQDCLEKFLKIKYALKNTGKSHEGLEKSLNFFLFSVGINTVDIDLNQNKNDVPLFGAAYAAPRKGTTILY